MAVKLLLQEHMTNSSSLLCHQALLSSAIPQTLTLYHILVASNPSVVLTEHHVTCEKVLKYLTKNPGLAVTS